MMRKQIILCICTFMTVFFCCGDISINAEEDRVVRVGYPIQEGLTNIDEDGKYNGYTYEYIQEMALYNGWHVEFVQVDGDINESLSTLMKMLKDGEIDLMGGMSYNEAMDEIYDYSSRSYGIAYTTLVILNNKTFIVDSTSVQKVRIAVHTNANKRLQELNEYCEMNLINPEYVYFDDEEAMVEAMRRGEADAMLSTSASFIDGVRTVAKFAPKPFYFITTSGNSELVKEINLALQNIEQTNPYFMSQMEEKYFSSMKDHLVISDEEQAFINEGRVFKAGVLTNQPPFQYRDEKGELKGIAVDVLKSIAEKTGLKIELIPIETTAQLDEMLVNKEIDIRVTMTYDYDFAEELRIQMTNPYLEAQYIMMMNDSTGTDNLTDKTLALTKSIEYNHVETTSAKWYDTIEECVMAVNNGEADYMFGDNYVVQYFINKPQVSNIYLIPQTYDVHRICFGLVRQSEHHLLNIMNKAVMAFPDEEMQTIIFLNTTYDNDYELQDLINKYPVTFVLLVSGVSVLIILALLWGLRTKSKMSNKIQLDLKKHLQVYELSSDHFFEYDFSSDTVMISKKGDKGESFETYKGNESDIHDERSRFREEVFFKLLKDGKDTAKDLLCPTEEGGLHWYRFTFKTVYDEQNNPAYCIGKISDIDGEKKEQERLKIQAELDSLTNVYNAATSRRIIQNNIENLPVNQCDSLLLIDIDNFKHINDSFGHLSGDKVLCNLADLLMQHFMKSRCVIGRPGGDEFIAYIRNTDKEEVQYLCEELLRHVSEMDNEGSVHVSVSIGAVLVYAGDDYEHVYQKADEAMYDSKKNGRNRYEIAQR